MALVFTEERAVFTIKYLPWAWPNIITRFIFFAVPGLSG
jgi:hypothetical protein